METLISQDFEFNVLSVAYAQFILECSNGYPEGRIEKISQSYQQYRSDINPNSIVVNFKSPESIAVFLKLKFGAHLYRHPEMKKDDYIKDIESKIQTMSIYDPPKWIKESTYDWDRDEYKKDIMNKIQNYKGTSTKE